MSGGAMDQIGQLAFQQMREITIEVDQLDHKHQQFTSMCSSTKAIYNSNSNRLSSAIASHLAKASKYYSKWNRLMTSNPGIAWYPKQKQKRHKWIVKREKQIVKAKARRAAAKKVYDQDIVDFAQALKDIDGLRKIIANSLSGKQTSTGTARTGLLETKQQKSQFLEAIDTVESDRMRQMTHRLVLGADFLEEQASAPGQTSGVDKLDALLVRMRNEMHAEMDKLSEVEAKSIAQHKSYMLKTRDLINRQKIAMARLHIRLGRRLTRIGNEMIREANEQIVGSKRRKELDRIIIEKDFLDDECAAEPPLYHKQRDNKIAEIKTLEAMLKILKNLNWNGAVYNAVSRIQTSAVNSNPEPGFVMKYEMDVYTGMPLKTPNYRYQAAEKPSDFSRVAIKMSIGSAWVWVSFDAFDSDPQRYLIPTTDNGLVAQQYVDNLVIHKSPSAHIQNVAGKGATRAKGNVEFWSSAYTARNAFKVPGASDGAFDFGDERKFTKGSGSSVGCFQVHDYMNKQTLLAVNNFLKKGKQDVGIGSQSSTRLRDQPDWTGANNIQGYKNKKEAVTLTWYFLPRSAATQKTAAKKDTAAKTTKVAAKPKTAIKKG
jgi:hemerythrin